MPHGPFSPLLWQWSLKVMPDTLFLMFFWWCLERLVTVYIEKKETAWWQACLLGALAALTRPEGILLLLWILISGVGLSNQGIWKRILAILVMWTGPLYFLSQKFMTLIWAYQEGMGQTEGDGQVHFPFVKFIDHLYAYMSQPVYIFTPLVSGSPFGDCQMSRRKDLTGEAFVKIILQICLLIFISRLIPTGYQDRHFMPFLPLLLLAAGYQLEMFFESLDKQKGHVRLMVWKNGLLTLCLSWMALFSAGVLISQYDSFGDIKRSSEYLKTLPDKALIYFGLKFLKPNIGPVIKLP